MVAYTDSLGFNKGTAAFPAPSHRFHFFETVLDFKAIAAARVAAGATALAATDTLEVLQLPAGTLVLAAGAQTLTVEGATATMGLGDSGSATRYLTGHDLATTAFNSSALAEPRFLASASSVLVTLNHAGIDTAVVRVWLVAANVNAR